MQPESSNSPGGFTFADKRKVNPDGTARVPKVTDTEAAQAASVRRGTPGFVDASTEAGPDEAATSHEATPHEATPHDAPIGDPTAISDASEPSDDAPIAVDLAAERLADLQRLQAEYANYRKRVDRDRNVARETAIASVLESLLPVLDDIHLARQHGDLESGPFVSIAEKLEATLARYGVERYGSAGEPFDPAVHDALMHVDDELAEGTDVTTVVSVLQPGYRVGEKVIRPARVSVADPS